jgi:hypothetical protein
MTKICKKAAQHFHCAVSKVFDRVKCVALWSANIRKLAKDHKGHGSAAKFFVDSSQHMIDLNFWNFSDPIVEVKFGRTDLSYAQNKNRGKKMRRLGMDTCPSLNDIMEIRKIVSEKFHI